MSKQRITYLSHYHYGDDVYVHGKKGWISAVTFTCEDNVPAVYYEVTTDTKVVVNVMRSEINTHPKLKVVH